MKAKKVFLINLVLALTIGSSIIAFSQTGFLKRLELVSLDFLFRLRKPLPTHPKLIIIEIDDENISKVGRWPWERTWHAAIVKALKDLGAKYIYFDIIFSEPSYEQADDLLSAAIKDARNVYLPFAFQGRSTDIQNAFVPIKKFSSYIKGTGSINITPDIDGNLRKIPLFFIDKEGLNHHIALKIAMDYSGSQVKQITPDYLIISNSKEETKIPLIEGNKMLINWAGRWKDTFKHYSFLDVLNAYRDSLENKEPGIDLEPFKNSICIVAVTAIGLYDIKPIPLEPEYPGVGATVTAISNILNKRFVRVVPAWINWLLIYIVSLLPPLLILKERPLREILLIISVVAIFFIINFLFNRGIGISLAFPLLALFGSYIVVATYNFARISIERKSFFKLAVTDELTNLYNIRYFRMVIKAECLMAEVDPTKIFCIIMCDVDHFKHFNDTYGHQTGDLVLKHVSGILRDSVRSSDIVSRYGGEEMIILLRGSVLKNALLVAEKIRKSVEDTPASEENNTYKVTISLGVACFQAQDDQETIIKRADSGLYKAKNSGRNRVETIEAETPSA